LHRSQDKENLNPTAIKISRRIFLKRGAVILGVGIAISGAARAVTSAKVSQTQAGYKNSPNGGARCDKCVQFQPPSACKIVAGAVSPAGSCNFFAPRPK
jgi:hypothetical protein